MRGAILGEALCGRCHGIQAPDRSAHPQAPTFRAIARKYRPEQLQEALAEGIVVGHPDMPEVTLSPKQVDDLIAHLKRLRR